MIKKIKRSEDVFDQGKYNLKLIDREGNSFTMMVGGNLDLYWVPDDFKNTDTFYIDKSDEFVYRLFLRLFQDIESVDDKYNLSLIGNKFTFISEDFNEDIANKLEIIKKDNEFVINFLKNENKEGEHYNMYAFFRRGCPICFCNSGSRVPKIEHLFMMLFNDLAYNNKDIELDMC